MGPCTIPVRIRINSLQENLLAIRMPLSGLDVCLHVAFATTVNSLKIVTRKAMPLTSLNVLLAVWKGEVQQCQTCAHLAHRLERMEVWKICRGANKPWNLFRLFFSFDSFANLGLCVFATLVNLDNLALV